MVWMSFPFPVFPEDTLFCRSTPFGLRSSGSCRAGRKKSIRHGNNLAEVISLVPSI